MVRRLQRIPKGGRIPLDGLLVPFRPERNPPPVDYRQSPRSPGGKSKNAAGRIAAIPKNQSTIRRVPPVISTAPITDLTLTASCRKMNASTIVMTRLNLSMGTTLETSPIWMAL